MFSNRIGIAVLSLVFALASCVSASEPAPLDVYNGPVIAPGQEFEVASYYPMAIGNYWKYQDTAENNVQFKLELKKRVAVNGKQAFLFERSTRLETDAITAEADGMMMHAQERTNRDGSVFRATWTPAIKFAAAKTKIGEKCVTVPSFVNPGTGNTMTWTSTIVGTQDVTVGTHKFTNCVKIKVLVTDTKLGVKLSEFEMWVAKGIGVVKRQGNFFGVYFVQNLLEWKA